MNNQQCVGRLDAVAFGGLKITMRKNLSVRVGPEIPSLRLEPMRIKSCGPKSGQDSLEMWIAKQRFKGTGCPAGGGVSPQIS